MADTQLEINLLEVADTKDRVAMDTKDSKAECTEDTEGVDAEAEDVDHLHRGHRTQIYLRSAGNLHHFLVEEQEHKHHQIL